MPRVSKPKKPMNPKYAKQRAICLLAAALEHLDITYLADPTGVLIQKKTGKLLWVKVTPDSAETLAPDLIELNAADVISREQVVRDRVLHMVTEAAGYGRPSIIDRGPDPACGCGASAKGAKPRGKGHARWCDAARVYGEDHDRVILRESVFRNTINPTEAVYKKLDPVIMTCVRFFYRKNKDLCVRLGYDMGDLKTYAQVWAANFWNTGRTLGLQDHPEDPDGGNRRLLYSFLRQRFSEFNQQMRNFRTRGVLVDWQAVEVGLGVESTFQTAAGPADLVLERVAVGKEATTIADLGRCECGSARPRGPAHYSWCPHRTLETDEEGDGEYGARARKPEIDLSSPEARRLSARALLLKYLGNMTHSDMLEALTDTARSMYACPDTRSEAVKQLVIHRKSCSTCGPLDRKTAAAALLEANAPFPHGGEVALDVGEEVLTIDPGSSLE